jgi:hypothetical protein
MRNKITNESKTNGAQDKTRRTYHIARRRRIIGTTAFHGRFARTAPPDILPSRLIVELLALEMS